MNKMMHLRFLRRRTLGAFNARPRPFSSKDDSSNDGANSQKPSSKNAEITDKINDLLKDMMTKSKDSGAGPSVPDYSQTGGDRKLRRDARKAAQQVKKSPEANLQEAAMAVAEVFGGDKEKTQKEIVARALGETAEPVNLNWSELISGMEVDNTKSADDKSSSRSQQVRGAFDRMNKEYPDFKQLRVRSTGSKFKVEEIDLFGGKPLGIFKRQATTPNYGAELRTWSELEKYNLRLATTHPPSNYFEKMILWTKQGKVWKYPIDNEQGFEEERLVDFSDHVFLEGHLEGWCPDRGPLRHFMELVCVGLSKNPYVKVQDKIDHIMWFKDYFEDKKKLLMEIGAYGKEHVPPKISQ